MSAPRIPRPGSPVARAQGCQCRASDSPYIPTVVSELCALHDYLWPHDKHPKDETSAEFPMYYSFGRVLSDDDLRTAMEVYRDENPEPDPEPLAVEPAEELPSPGVPIFWKGGEPGDVLVDGEDGHPEESPDPFETRAERSQRRSREATVMLGQVVQAGEEGLTVAEVRVRPPWVHHGAASGAMSRLHKREQVARLATPKRDGYAIYVAPIYLNDRPTVPQGRRRPALTADELALIETFTTQIDAKQSSYVTIDASSLTMLITATERLNR